MTIEETAVDGECSFGKLDTNDVQYINDSINVSDYMMLNGQNVSTFPHSIKNIIYMIPDGAGWGTYDLANAVKQKIIADGKTKINGALTTLTTDAISGMTVNGLYLDQFLVGSANTLLANFHDGSPITDSAAAGTAIACGKKTNYLRVAADENMIALPTILELCKLEGKSTGVVTTKSWIDATPTTFLSHSNERANKAIFQREISLQMLSSGVDLLLAYGTSTGVYTKTSGYLHSYDASDFGYTVVDNLAEMNSAVANGVTKPWSNFTEGNNNNGNAEYDVSANHISYDINGLTNQLSLLDMTKAALKVLSTNINDSDGFFLMVEGGAIDNAAESVYATEAVGEYLAFDEAFAYCVNWAKGRDDTIVIALPDHDSGGFKIGENVPNTEATVTYDLDKNSSLSKSECLNYVVDTIISGTDIGSVSNLYVYSGQGKAGHTAHEVPVWMYSPDWCRNAMLYALGIPTDTSPEKVRTGSFYPSLMNSEYKILNSDVSPAVIKVCGLMNFAEAQSQLLVDADNYVKSIDTNNHTITLNNNEVIYMDSNKWVDPNGGAVNTFTTEFCSYVFKDSLALDKVNNTVYLPRDFLIACGYISN
jgi:alkaline phosphatase